MLNEMSEKNKTITNEILNTKVVKPKMVVAFIFTWICLIIEWYVSICVTRKIVGLIF